MRTKPPNILPGCPYCDHEHNPDIQCRYLNFNVNQGPELREPKPVQRSKPQLIHDVSGKLIAVHFTSPAPNNQHSQQNQKEA